MSGVAKHGPKVGCARKFINFYLSVYAFLPRGAECAPRQLATRFRPDAQRKVWYHNRSE
jgi:hypothetical protein